MTDPRTNEEIVESTRRHLEAVERYERWTAQIRVANSFLLLIIVGILLRSCAASPNSADPPPTAPLIPDNQPHPNPTHLKQPPPPLTLPDHTH
ncbi:MAG: hypothetical protein OXF41_19480 [bacterium]|nr:hypothetical protein [bacterium]